jgi:hypothetical protein
MITDGSLAAISGNLNDEKSNPAFIKIDGSSIGSSYNVQNIDKIPEEISPKIAISDDFRAEAVRYLQMLLRKLPSAFSPF